MVGLTYLSRALGASDEETVRRWVENPYHRYFWGEEYFQHTLPIDPSSLSRWWKRIGKEGAELTLKLTVTVGLVTQTVKPTSLERVVVDTTIQEKAIAYPTDSRLYNRSRERLVRLAVKQGISLRQNYQRLGSRVLMKAGRYAHARQMRRAGREIKRLKTYLGRALRDIVRKIAARQDMQPVFHSDLVMAERLLTQKKNDKNKLYSLHAPKEECIAKSKAHKKYEFGVKVSVTSTNRDNFVVGMLAEPANPYDAHTLGRILEQVRRIAGCAVKRGFVDRGYRGHNIDETTQVLISGRKQG